MSTTAIDRDRHRTEQPRHQRQRHRNRAEPNPRRPAYRFYTNPGTLPEGIRRVPHAALCTARLRPTRTRRAAGSQWVARPAVLSTARYAADRLRNVGLPNRQKPQGMSCEAMGEFRVSVPRGGLRTASIYAFLGWDLMRPGFPPFDGRVPAFSERWNQICCTCRPTIPDAAVLKGRENGIKWRDTKWQQPGLSGNRGEGGSVGGALDRLPYSDL